MRSMIVKVLEIFSAHYAGQYYFIANPTTWLKFSSLQMYVILFWMTKDSRFKTKKVQTREMSWWTAKFIVSAGNWTIW